MRKFHELRYASFHNNHYVHHHNGKMVKLTYLQQSSIKEHKGASIIRKFKKNINDCVAILCRFKSFGFKFP